MKMKLLLLFPFLLSDCVWENEPFAKLLITPHDAKPINNKKYWATIDEALTYVAKSLEKTVDDVKKSKSATEICTTENSLPNKEVLAIADLEKTRALIKQEKNELNFRSTKEDIARIHDLWVKSYDELFKDLESQIDFVASKKELMYSSALFDTIYASEVIHPITIVAIQKLRGDNENYKWYDRSILVSALTLSLINFKFDFKKANMLLDFVTDFEPKVWERALTGLIIAIIYQKNRAWLRDNNFVHRLETLQNNEQIQDGLKTIDFILKNELYKYNLYNTELFKKDLFKSPMNSFVPFYDDNSVLKEAIDNADNDFDIHDFKAFLQEVPFLDSHKYSLCISLSTTGLTKEKIEDDKAKIINKSLNISNNFRPFQNLISEYYFFFNYFPEKLKDDVFKKQLLLTKTDLKKYILNKVNHLLLEANSLQESDSYNEAITKYQDLLRIEPSHKDAHWQLGMSFYKKNDNKKALETFIKLENLYESNNDLFYRIALCYNKLKEYNKSNTYCDKIEEKTNNFKFSLFILKATNYEELFDNDAAYNYCQKAEERALDEEDFYLVAQIYSGIEKNNDALRIINKTPKTKQDAKYWRLLGVIYCDLFKWDLSILALEKSKELDAKSDLINISLGRAYLFSKLDLEKARIMFERDLKRKSDDKAIAYGNLGHYYLIKGETDVAFEEYVKCIQLLKNTTNFNKKMEIDLKFMLNLKISEKAYYSLKDKVIKHYNTIAKN